MTLPIIVSTSFSICVAARSAAVLGGCSIQLSVAITAIDDRDADRDAGELGWTSGSARAARASGSKPALGGPRRAMRIIAR